MKDRRIGGVGCCDDQRPWFTPCRWHRGGISDAGACAHIGSTRDCFAPDNTHLDAPCRMGGKRHPRNLRTSVQTATDTHRTSDRTNPRWKYGALERQRLPARCQYPPKWANSSMFRVN